MGNFSQTVNIVGDEEDGMASHDSSAAGGDRQIGRQEPGVEEVTEQAHLFDPTLLPVASERDARQSARAVLPYLTRHDGSLVVVHVIERWPGWPDPSPPDMQVERAHQMFHVVSEICTANEIPFEAHLLEGTDVAATILEAADRFDVTSIAFARRNSHWVTRYLTRNVGKKLLASATQPVLTLSTDS
jgi:nucleotide-binding universal stress UspA family protein